MKDGNNRGGRRKDGKPFKEGNERKDGSYEVGKNRPPKDGQYKTGDSRKRGRRAKGTKNYETYFTKESARIVGGTINGSPFRMPALQAAVMMAFTNAVVARENPAIALVLEHARRLNEKAERQAPVSQLTDQELIEGLREALGFNVSDSDTISDDLDLDTPREETSDEEGA